MLTFGYIYITIYGCIVAPDMLFFLGVIKMKCENIMCIYENGGVCSLDEITIDLQAKCTECINVSIDNETLNQRKREMLLDIESRY